MKDEAWWLVLGNTSTSELYALKRVSFADRLVTTMQLPPKRNDFQVKVLPATKIPVCLTRYFLSPRLFFVLHQLFVMFSACLKVILKGLKSLLLYSK